ncbi:MAG: S1 RNA-binding domain-containing protein, partial [Planctomycetales bacterium]|nr:S1 RNA-binding domain-containing protein [Planctomycetales bacterium]
RELTKLKLLHFLSTKIGEQMEAVITGVEEFGLFAQGLKLPAEGLIHVSELDDDHYHYDATTHTLMGSRPGHTFRLGDLVRVEIARVDMDLRELDFRIVGRAKTNTGFKKKAAGSIDERMKRSPRSQRREKNRGTSNQNRTGKSGRGRKGKRKY